MTDTTAGEGVKRPKFGDIVENGWASEDNPTRRGFFVREFTRSGKMNAGRTWEITDGKGKFWEFKPKDIAEDGRLKVIAVRSDVSAFHEATQRVRAYVDQADKMGQGAIMVATSDLRATLAAQPSAGAQGDVVGVDRDWMIKVIRERSLPQDAADMIIGAMRFAATPSQPDTGDVAALREATGGEAVIRGGKIVISIDVDALPMIVSGSCATYRLDGLWKVTDAEAFAKDVCISLNAESENGTTRVHKMFDGAFAHAIDQGAEGIDAITEPEFEVEASRLRLAALSKPNAPRREG